MTPLNGLKKALVFTKVFLLFPFLLSAQTDISDLLFQKSACVFQGTVTKMRYELSDGGGSHFSMDIQINKWYKGENPASRVTIPAYKLDVIDLELDTTVLDYSFQVTKDSTYLFFTKNIIGNQEKGFATQLFDAEIEGLPFTPASELWAEHQPPTQRIPPTAASPAEWREQKATAVFLGKVLSIQQAGKKGYWVSVQTKADEKRILVQQPTCVCKDRQIQIGHYYVFYTDPLKRKKYQSVDEWLGVEEASEYDRVKYTK